MVHHEARQRIAERLHQLLERHGHLAKPLRPYQLDTCRATFDWLADPQGSRTAYVQQATGLGKTVDFAAMATFCHGLRVLVIVPSRVLVEQTIRAIVAFTGGVVGFLAAIPNVLDAEGRVIGARGLDHSDIVVTTDDSFCRGTRAILERFNPHLIIFDECHWALTGPNSYALKQFTDAVVIGFSAAPDYLSTAYTPGDQSVQYENGQILYAAPSRLATSTFETLLDKRTIRDGTKDGWLSPLAWATMDLDMNLDGVPLVETFDGGVDYQPSALTSALDRDWSRITKAVCHAYKENQFGLADMQVFSVCSSVAQAAELAEALRGINVPAQCVVGMTAPKERRRILGSYDDRALSHLTSVMVLREGWDSRPQVCLMLRPTKSVVAYVQTVGRILRPAAGKLALIVDGSYSQTRFTPLNAPSLFADVGSTVRTGEILLNVKDGAPGPATPVTTPPSWDIGEPFTVLPFATEKNSCSGSFLVVDGELWGTKFSLGRQLGINENLIASWAAQGGIRGRNGPHRHRSYYALNDIIKNAERDDHPLAKNGALAAKVAALQPPQNPHI